MSIHHSTIFPSSFPRQKQYRSSSGESRLKESANTLPLWIILHRAECLPFLVGGNMCTCGLLRFLSLTGVGSWRTYRGRSSRVWLIKAMRIQGAVSLVTSAFSTTSTFWLVIVEYHTVFKIVFSEAGVTKGQFIVTLHVYLHYQNLDLWQCKQHLLGHKQSPLNCRYLIHYCACC